MNATPNQLQLYDHQDSAPPMLNIYSLKKETDSRSRNRFKIYETILKKCHHRIKVAATSHRTESCTFFVVPSYLIGMPTFDLESCCDFLINQLSRNGFQIIRLANTLLFISWKHIRFDASKEREMNECIRFLHQKANGLETHSLSTSQEGLHSSFPETNAKETNSNTSTDPFRSIHDAPSTEKFLML